jgi:DNA polymerase elongation subunit (family B)
MTLWLIPKNGNRKRHRLIDRSFTPSFYAHGPEPRLAGLKRALEARARVSCALTEKENIWDGQALRVLQVAVHHPPQYGALVRFTHRYDSGLRLFNSDLMLAPLYCWEKDLFPLAQVEVDVDERVGAGLKPAPAIHTIQCRDDAWMIDYELPPFETMRMRLEGSRLAGQVDPQHGRRGALEVEVDGDWRVLDDSEEPVAIAFERLLRRHDPDLIVSEWGDSTLFPALLRDAVAHRTPEFERALNRESVRVERRRARSYMSYGRMLFKGSTTTLFGRLHVDVQNSFVMDHCMLEGLWELARVTKLPVQYAARTTTGTGISYMQMELAYRDGVLIPEQKAEPEGPKHPDELLLADRGGLVFPPRLGFFTNVAELDFISEYPSIMARFNVSPETVNCACCPEAPKVPELGYRICQRRRGITSRVVERLIEKRQQFKQRSSAGIRPSAAEASLTQHFASALPACGPKPSTDVGLSEPGGRRPVGTGWTMGPGEEPQRRAPAPGASRSVQEPRSSGAQGASYKLRRSALKWLLVCCFGYTGYKNARFGKIEAHEAINALAREKLLVAKETAERQGFRVLHALVDSLYVRREGAQREDYERLAREIEQRTDLPLAVEALYRYVVFLPSKQDPEIPVPNRFFCVSEEGELKVRGLECRKHDTPPLVAKMQAEALAILAEARDFRTYRCKLEEARQVFDRYLERVKAGDVSVEELIISRRLTRSPGEYQKNSATAIAARQLDRAGVRLRPGETIEYIVTDGDSTLPDDRVRALTLWEGWRGYDASRYQEMLRDAFRPLEHYALSETYGTSPWK